MKVTVTLAEPGEHPVTGLLLVPGTTIDVSEEQGAALIESGLARAYSPAGEE